MTNQVAITMLKNLEQSLDDYCELNDEGKEAFHMAITALELFGNSEQLPSVQPRKGKWIEDRDGIYHCSCCNTDYLIYEWAMKDTHYCPNCGADMRGEQE